MKPRRQSGIGRIPDVAIHKLGYVDSLRGIAILMVISVHAAHSISGLAALGFELATFGQMGVQLFFVASAYTLCRSYVLRQGEVRATRHFYLRRFFRIAPLYYCAIALYLAVAVAVHGFNAATQHAYTPLNVVANALFVHGFIQGPGSPSENTVVPGGWSIGTEMAFYVLFPAFFWLFAILAKRSRLCGFALAAGIFALTSAVIVGLVEVFDVPLYNGSFLYFNLLNQLSVFALGAAAFFFYQGSAERSIACVPVSLVAFTVLNAGAFVLFRHNAPMSFVVIPALAGAGFVFLLDALKGSRFHSRTLERIGQVSYSMYIFHFVVLYAARMALAHFSIPVWPVAQYVLLLILVAAVPFGVSLISERVIEKPGIALGRKLVSPELIAN